MPFAVLSYPVRTGCDDEVAEIFSSANFRRVDSPFMVGEDGRPAGLLTATGLFLQGDTIVRVVQHEGGTVADIARHMSEQDGVHEAERALMPYLPEPRDTETPAGFVRHFQASLLQQLDQSGMDNRPAEGLLVLRYPIRSAGAVRALATGGVRPGVAGIVRTGLFLHDRFVVRVVQHEGEEAAALAHLAEVPETWLGPALAPGTDAGCVPPMRCVSFLSAAVSPR
jgi:hypothetical protein